MSRKRRWSFSSLYLGLGALVAIASASATLGDDVSCCYSPSPETLANGVIREWIAAGGGNVSNAENFFPICSLDSDDPFQPPGIYPLYLAPRSVDTVFIASSLKGRDSDGWPLPDVGSVVGTITLDGDAYRGVGVFATGENNITLSVPGVVQVDSFAAFGLPDASTLAIVGGGTIAAKVGMTLGSGDVNGSISVSDVRQSGPLLSTPDLQLQAGNQLTQTGDVIIAAGQGSDGSLAIPDSSDGEQRRLDLIYGTQALYVGAQGDGYFSMGAHSEVKAGGVFIGSEADSTGEVEVRSSAKLLATKTPLASITVGDRGFGRLTLEANSFVQSAGDLTLAAAASGQGKLELRQGSELKLGSTLGDGIGALRIGGYDKGLGDGGQGEVAVAGGKIAANGVVLVGASENSIGTLRLVDHGELELQRRLVVGHAGEGTMRVAGTAKVTIQNPDGDEGLRIGRWRTGKGLLVLSGADARLTGVGKKIVVGLEGDGAMQVEDGFDLHLPDAEVTLGQEAESVGRLTVRGLGSRLTSNRLRIGNRGSAYVDVREGGVLVTRDGASFGQIEFDPDAAASYLVTVDGVGSRWETVGGLDDLKGLNLSADNGTAELIVSNGGVVRIKPRDQITSNGERLVLADQLSGSARLRVSGAGSRLELPPALVGDQVIIGRSGRATLEILEQASAQLGDLLAAESSTSQANVEIGGRGTIVELGEMIAGLQGIAEVAVRNGARLINADDVVVGDEEAGRGTVTISGVSEQSSWELRRSVTLGKSGTGTLNVLNGGLVDQTSGVITTIGAESKSHGVINVAGNGAGGRSTLRLGGDALMGANGGVGELHVSQGGSVEQEGPNRFRVGNGAFDGHARISVSGVGSFLNVNALEIGGPIGVDATIVDIDQSAVLQTRANATVGKQGNVRMRLQDNARWNALGDRLTIGGEDLQSTTLQVSDGAVLNARQLVVNDRGSHTINIDARGEIISTRFEAGGGTGISSLTLGPGSSFKTGAAEIRSSAVGGFTIDVNAESFFEAQEFSVGAGAAVNVRGDGARLELLGDAGALEASGARIAIEEQAVVSASSARFNSNTRVRLKSGGQLTTPGDIMLLGTQMGVADGATVLTSGSIICDLSGIDLSGATTKMLADRLTVKQLSAMTLREGALLSINASLAVTDVSDLDARQGRVVIGVGVAPGAVGEVIVGLNGTLSTTRGGRLLGNVLRVQRDGSLKPGNSPGVMALGGDAILEAGSTLEIEIGGFGQGQYDFLDVLGKLTIEEGAQLDLKFIDGFAPLAGEFVDFIDADEGMLGRFDSIRVSGLRDGWQYAIGGVNGRLRLTSLNDGIAVVPEPVGSAMAMCIVTGIVVRLRRRRESALPGV